MVLWIIKGSEQLVWQTPDRVLNQHFNFYTISNVCASKKTIIIACIVLSKKMSPSQWWVVHQDRWWTASQSVGYAGWASSQSKNQTSWTPIPLLMIPGVAVRGVDPASPCVLTSSRIAAAVSPLMIHTSLTPEVLFNSLTLYVITWNWLFSEIINLLLFHLVTATRRLRSTSSRLPLLPFPRVNGAATWYMREGREPLFPLVQIHQGVHRERATGKGLLQLQGGTGL